MFQLFYEVLVQSLFGFMYVVLFEGKMTPTYSFVYQKPYVLFFNTWLENLVSYLLHALVFLLLQQYCIDKGRVF